MSIEVGKSYTVETVVNETNVANAFGNDGFHAFSTPMMINLMELAACKCLVGFLEEGQGSVGIYADVSHIRSTPIGVKVTAKAIIASVDRRQVNFIVTADDEEGQIGYGTHARFIVNIEEFMSKTNQKAGGGRSITDSALPLR